MLLLYRIFFPLIFPFFLPGLLWKLIRRSGYKKTYWERFSLFSNVRKQELSNWQGAIWLHAVSVGETNLALSTLKRWNERNPDRRYILSTTTTTGQEIARTKAPANVKVIFCPIDCALFVKRTLSLLNPSALVIFETELWPNLVMKSKERGMKLALVNTRISDKSYGGYRRFRSFFAPILDTFDLIALQTALDRERILSVAPSVFERAIVTGNIKFDQAPPHGDGFDYCSVFGTEKRLIVLAASTHQPEEKLILDAYLKFHKTFPASALAIVPRHAERGGEIEKLIQESGLTYLRRSRGDSPSGPVECLLADTTGELAGFMKTADIVIMGKTLAGNDEGQNIIEPALMGRAIICGMDLKNFRQALDALVRADGVMRIAQDSQLSEAMASLAGDPDRRAVLGNHAQNAITANRGALDQTITLLEEVL